MKSIRLRGPDIVEVYEDKGVFLAYGHLGLSRYKVSNLLDQNSKIKIIGDLRLDNRAELAKQLGVPSWKSVPNDLYLLERAYLTWGVELCQHIFGEFAFAIWDSQKNKLFCGRDHFGIRPFFYKKEEGQIVFSSSEKSLGATALDPLNDTQIGDMLLYMPQAADLTIHDGIYRLRPAHSLTWNKGNITTRRYWQLKIQQFKSEDPEGEFRLLFEQAIQSRIREEEDTIVGSMLSGGLDSTAVCCMAEKKAISNGLSLDVYSLIFEKTPSLDERPYINTVLGSGNFRSCSIPSDEVPAFSNINDIFDEQVGFHLGANNAVSRRIFDAASKDGKKILLDGHGGDEVVWHGMPYLNDLARQGRWLEVCKLVNTVCGIYGENRFLTLFSLISNYGRPRYLRRLFRFVLKKRNSALSNRRKDNNWKNCIHPDFSERTGLWKRYWKHLRVSERTKLTDYEWQLRSLTSPIVELAFEAQDKTSASKQLEVRYPFYDVRLVEFCLSLPSSEKLRYTETRSIMRRALKGIIPEKIRTRQDKTSFLPAISNSILYFHRDILNKIVSDDKSKLFLYVNKNELSVLINDFIKKSGNINGGDILFIWRVVSLYIWLDEFDRKNR